MVNDPEKNHRKSIRLQGYDYTAAGYYFSTICTHQWQCYFGEVHNGEMELNPFGRIVKDEWLATAQIRNNVELQHIRQYINNPRKWELDREEPDSGGSIRRD
jgi:hypothetical protein